MIASVRPTKIMTSIWLSPAKASRRVQSMVFLELRHAGGEPPVFAAVVGAPDLAAVHHALDLRGLVDEVDVDHLHDRAVRLRLAGAYLVAGHLDVVQPVLLFARQHQALARGGVDEGPGRVPVAPADGVAELGHHVDLRVRHAGTGGKQQEHGDEQERSDFAHGAHYARFSAKRAASVATGVPSSATTRACIATRARP